MKKCFGLLGLATLALTAFGCNGVAYNSSERGQMIARNWDLEYRQINDDIDTILLLRPVSQLTPYNIRH